MRGALAAHPGSESFIEPEIVPPCHGYKIPEPHVRHLMRQYLVDVLLGLGGRTLRIKKKRRFVISDAAPVLHCPTKTAGNSNLIQLRQWIGHAKIIVVV